jgi:hypothetical protein
MSVDPSPWLRDSQIVQQPVLGKGLDDPRRRSTTIQSYRFCCSEDEDGGVEDGLHDGKQWFPPASDGK